MVSAAMLLSGRRALVIGASGAVGSAIRAVLEEHGAETVGADLVPLTGDIEMDVRREDSVAAGFEAAGPVTDVVNAAGSLLIGRIADMDPDDFRSFMDVNVTGAFLVARQAATRLPRGGSLTLIASQAGYRGAALWGAYCAAKSAVIRLGQSLAQELGPVGLRVNCVCPGNVESPMADAAAGAIARFDGSKGGPGALREHYLSANPMGRYAEPREIGAVCAFFASPLASYVSGVALAVDGGEVSE